MIPEAAATRQTPGMEAGSLCEEECPTFRTCRGEDTLDAFGPLARYAQRPQTGNQTAHQAIVSAIAAPAGEVAFYRSNEPGSQGLMKVKTADQMMRGEQYAESMRKSRRKDLQSLKRTLNGNLTPRERSVSPMFSGLKARSFPA